MTSPKRVAFWLRSYCRTIAKDMRIYRHKRIYAFIITLSPVAYHLRQDDDFSSAQLPGRTNSYHRSPLSPGITPCRLEVFVVPAHRLMQFSARYDWGTDGPLGREMRRSPSAPCRAGRPGTRSSVGGDGMPPGSAAGLVGGCGAVSRTRFGCSGRYLVGRALGGRGIGFPCSGSRRERIGEGQREIMESEVPDLCVSAIFYLEFRAG
jgi:hypothetical protein